MYLSPLERLQLLLINFPETFSPSAPTPLAPAVIYLHCVFSPPPPRAFLPSVLNTPPPSLEAPHACRRWDIAFLILLTGANIYVLFFDIHCSCSRRTAGPEWDTRSTATKNKTKPRLLLCLLSASNSSSTDGNPAAVVVICISLRANRGQERRGQLSW